MTEHTIQRKLQSIIRSKDQEAQARREEFIPILTGVGGRLKEQVEQQQSTLSILRQERETTSAVLDQTAGRIQDAFTNLQRINSAPEIVGRIMQLFDDDWSRRYQKLEMESARVKLGQQQGKLDIARKSVQSGSRGIETSIKALTAADALSGRSQAERLTDIALEGQLRDREFIEKTQELEAKDLQFINSELSTIKAGGSSEFTKGRLETRQAILNTRNVLLQTSELALKAGKRDLAQILKGDYAQTLSFTELNGIVEEMKEKEEKVFTLESGLEFSFEELTQLRAQKREKDIAALKVSAERFTQINDAKVNIDNLKRTTLNTLNILAPATIEKSKHIISGAGSLVQMGNAELANTRTLEQIKVVQEELAVYTKEQPKLEQAFLKRLHTTGLIAPDTTNTNFVASRLFSNASALPDVNDPFGILRNTIGRTMREAIGSAGASLDITGREIDLASFAAQLGKTGAKIDPVVTLQNAADEKVFENGTANAREAFALLMGGKLFKNAIKELAVDSPQFANLLTSDGEDFKEEFKDGNLISSGRILRKLADAQVAISSGDNITTPFIDALIEKMRNPQYQDTFTKEWYNKYNSSEDKAFMMFLTGGHLLRGVDAYYSDLQKRSIEATELAVESEKQLAREIEIKTGILQNIEESQPIQKGMRESSEALFEQLRNLKAQEGLK